MSSYSEFWAQGDAVTRAVALLLLLMSVSAWMLILWKSWVLGRARRDLARAVPAFWAAADLEAGRIALQTMDRELLLLPMLDAATATAQGQSLEAAGRRESQLTRRLRDALHQALRSLQWGQVLLASIGSTAPFVGLFGTVWGIYHALVAIGTSGQSTIDKVAGPIGEALIMTALGLAVAIPAVLGYNALVRGNKSILGGLNSFAHDLHAYFVTGARVNAGGEQAKVLPIKKGN